MSLFKQCIQIQLCISRLCKRKHFPKWVIASLIAVFSSSSILENATINFTFLVNHTQFLVFTIQVIGTGDGYISVDNIQLDHQGQITYPSGHNLLLKAVPANASSRFKRWSGDCTGSQAYIVVRMDSNTNCYAEFVEVIP